MFDWVKKLLGSSNDAEVKKLQKTVNAVEALEDEYKALTDEQLRAKTDEFRTRLQNGETEDDILPEALWIMIWILSRLQKAKRILTNGL